MTLTIMLMAEAVEMAGTTDGAAVAMALEEGRRFSGNLSYNRLTSMGSNEGRTPIPAAY